MLSLCGVTKIHDAASSNQAIKLLGLKSFDLVLCEYELGGGQDGQQLLEDLRHHQLISLSSMFFMVTAEGDYGKVVSAAELAPTDYILKPFTADRLLERIARALERREAMMPVYALMEEGSQGEAIAACIAGEQEHPRYALDFLRLRAELHMFLGEPAEADPIYRELAEAKAVPWARLGLAKTLFARERFDEARGILDDLVTTNKNFVDAYDWLARTHAAVGALDKSQQVLESAVAVSPHVVRRLRTLGETALEAGDVGTAEKSLRQVVSKAKYSEFRDPEDHVKLVRTLVKKGDADQAASVIRDLDRSLGGQKHAGACSAISSAILHEHTGNEQRLAAKRPTCPPSSSSNWRATASSTTWKPAPPRCCATSCAMPRAARRWPGRWACWNRPGAPNWPRGWRRKAASTWSTWSPTAPSAPRPATTMARSS
jgi:DNA-binding response OmpR family regulator